MQVQNKLNAMIFEMVIENFRGIEIFAYQFDNGNPLVVYGENGAGKTAIIIALYAALDKRKIPIKYDNLVGPYSIEAIKKAKISLGIKGDKGILELNGKTLEKFFVNFTITEKGNVNLSLTDAETGEVDKSPSKEKIKNLLGLFIDPVDLVKTLEAPHGDRNLAEKLAAMVGIDFKPFTQLEESLFQEKQEENRELKRQEGEYAGSDEPQEEWATKYVDPALISAELQRLNEFNTKEEEKVRLIGESNKEYLLSVRENERIDNDVVSCMDNVSLAKKDFDEKTEKLKDYEFRFENFKESSKPHGWEDEKSVLKIEEEIKGLTEKAQRYRKFDQDTAEGCKNIEIGTERLTQAKKSFDEKSEAYDNKKLKQSTQDGIIETKKEALDNSTLLNKPTEWTGEKDPEGIKTPLQFLNDKMANVEKDNKEVSDRKKHTEAEEGIELVKQSIKNIDAKRKTNQEEKSKVVAGVEFPMGGITVDENTVWYDSGDNRGKQTIIDRSEGEQMRICTNILIAGNTGPLNVIVVRQGHALSQKSQNIIFEVAAEHGYTVILETIISEKPGSVLIEAGNAKSVIPVKMQTVEEANESVKEEKEDSDSEFNW
jgi:hypothetical protein